MLRFTQVDVFTDEFTRGNPVAVVHDADSLDDRQLADFARWTNLSETTFLLAPTDPAADYRLRIFTTARELPFAGHPTLGSARAWLAAGGLPRHGTHLVQQCGAGLVPVHLDGDRLAFEAPPLLRGGPVSAEDIADLAVALELGPDEVVAAQWCDNGPGWVGLLLRDAERVLSLRPDRSRFGRFTDIGVVGPYPPGGGGPEGVAFEVRAFMATDAALEDPVTGSLNAALGQWLIPAGLAPASYVAGQGTALGRRGRVHVSRHGDTVLVAGDTVIGIAGEVSLG